jgi:hypothetical protein
LIDITHASLEVADTVGGVRVLGVDMRVGNLSYDHSSQRFGVSALCLQVHRWRNHRNQLC